jgi:predicted outer membrane repeat protein
MVTIDQSTAQYYGGGIYVGVSNNNIQMDDIKITSCMSYSSGGGIQIDSQNKNIVFRQIIVDECSATYGGALYIYNYNSHVDIISTTFSYNTAFIGGAILIDSANDNVILSMVTIDHCNAEYYGGGVYVGVSNNNIQMDNIKITSCMSYDTYSSGGGAIQIDSYNKYIVLRQINIDECSATYGGALYI